MKKLLAFAVISIFSVNLYSNVDISLTKAEKDKVLSGKQVVTEIPNSEKQKKGSTYQSKALVKGTVEQIHKVLVDYSKYPKFMPNIEELKVTSQEKGVTIGEYRLGLPLGKYKKYRLKLWDEKSKDLVKVHWAKVPWPELKEDETIVDTQGVWIVKNFPEKEGHVLILYKVYTDPGHIPWGFGWIVDILTGKSIYKVIKAVRGRVDKLYYTKKAN